ncbi:MAG: hypothetical protein KC506_02870 [Nanoarchaeota archaeon]|nr:hypothetical protein [Nanoarchaeota archaeon]
MRGLGPLGTGIVTLLGGAGIAIYSVGENSSKGFRSYESVRPYTAVVGAGTIGAGMAMIAVGLARSEEVPRR